MLEPHALAFFLDELCVKYGHCLSPQLRQQLEAEPPPTAEAFAVAVLHAEGLDPFVEKRLYRQLLPFALQAFARRQH
jgi:hypothetical protein